MGFEQICKDARHSCCCFDPRLHLVCGHGEITWPVHDFAGHDVVEQLMVWVLEYVANPCHNLLDHAFALGVDVANQHASACRYR